MQRHIKAKPKRATHKAVQPTSKPRLVLVADDDADWRLLVRDVLANSDLPSLRVLEAADGLEALRILMRQDEHARTPPPDLVYLDCEMPRLGGMEVLESLRACPRLRAIPIVMLTGVNDEARMRRACELGAAAYIVKPPTIEELRRLIAPSAGYWLRAGPGGDKTPVPGNGVVERAA